MKPELLISSALPPGLKLGKKGHLFERIHSKNPFVVLGALARLGCGRPEYKLTEVK